MSRRAIKAIDWAAITTRVAESQRNELTAFKAASDQILRRMTANPESPPKLDWAYYRKNIKTPGLVDKFQKEFEAFKVPYPVDKYTAEIEAQEKKEEEAMAKFRLEADEMIRELTNQITKIQGLLPFEEMTMEDLAIIHPELAINVDNPTPWPHDKSILQAEEMEEKDDH
ncbi:ATP synthase peripheral stalk subunit d, mitochondrial [Halictus rubicundus]|uniref:ATP synthase peripheral stalk subunit d, mitochondrial n=1 Tax=Halictus rubicundus TaxID=77578 RepID=UPI004036B4B6